MKIGFSFGRCVGSIVRGEVKANDVLCIIARTFMENEDHVENVVNTYLASYLQGLDFTQCLETALELWRSGKIIQPRADGVAALQVPNEYVWMDLYPTTVDLKSNTVKEAWDAYRMLITLTEQLPEPNPNNTVRLGRRVSSV